MGPEEQHPKLNSSPYTHRHTETYTPRHTHTPHQSNSAKVFVLGRDRDAVLESMASLGGNPHGQFQEQQDGINSQVAGGGAPGLDSKLLL